MRSRYKSLVWVSIFLLLFSIFAPYPAAMAATNSNNDAQTVKFRDIQSHWAYNEIMELSAANIVAGFEDGTFQPNGNVTREQFLKMLVELRKLPRTSNAVPFKDVEQGRWSAPYIAVGVINGILLPSDFPDGFKPSQPITRYEMAIWIVRALQLSPQKEEKLLRNVKDQSDIIRNRDLIEAALETGIIQGYPDATFKGGNNSTRAEAAVMLVRALHYTPGTMPTPSSDASRKIVEFRPEVKQSKSTSYSKRDDVTWVINDPDLILNVGDVFVMPPNDTYLEGIAKKVVSVSQEKDALVVKTSVPRLKEIFSQLDIHSMEFLTPKMFVPANPAIQIHTNEVAIQDTSLTLPCIPISINKLNYEGIVVDASMNFCNVGAIVDIGISTDIDIWELDADVDFNAKLVLVGDVTTNVTVTAAGEATESKLIPLLATPLVVPVAPGINLEGNLYLRIDPNFKASFEFKFKDKFHLEEGFSVSLSDGFKAIDKTTNTATVEVNTKFDASLAAGPDFRLTLSLLGMAYAGADLFPGIRVSYNRNYEKGSCDSLGVSAILVLDAVAGYDVFVADGELKHNLIDASVPLSQIDLNCPPPPPPTNLHAELISVNIGGELQTPLGVKGQEVYLDRTNVQLTWDPASKATSYYVIRTDAADGHTVKFLSTNTTYIDQTAHKGNMYNYRVTAVNEYGESGPSNILTVKVVDLPPSAPQNLTASRQDATVTLNWDPINGLVTYNVKRAEGSSNNYVTIISGISDAKYTDTTTSILKDYSYIITAVDAGGESDQSNSVHVDIPNIVVTPVDPNFHIDNLTLLSPAPANFSASRDLNSGRIVLSWKAVDGATGYNVMRSDAENGTYQLIGAKVSGTTFTDTTAAIGVTYYYKVSAVNSKGAESRYTPIQSASSSYGIR
ncbi:fibronectin type 3 domain-containing protein [Paenibacillus sp. yr247]|uniref:S-layer homology domain-containing protein n=1 Tax=Paenibacillus sp. yr247 TaxID=1761880 RepID=UPI000888BC79|nr:S-layer homology domain-containing protein [Paenibacillus sp. yr247]SDP28572.1 fibronectin type 3 domain-containing protein [Paenibacillus sp. yr247]